VRQGARSENILHGSLSDEQRCRIAKDSQPLRARLWRAAAGVTPQSQSPKAMLPHRSLPATCQNLAHSFSIYESGSGSKTIMVWE
jgi:hypothetical protein